MRFDSLLLEHFCCFERLELKFDPSFNLIAGANGAGKTAILRALSWPLRDALGGTQLVHPNDARVTAQGTVQRIVFQRTGAMRLRITLSAFGLTCDFAQKIELKKSEFNGVAHDIAKIGDRMRNPDTDTTLPLVAFYPTGRSWRNVQSSSVDWNTAMRQQPKRSGGYERALEPRESLSEVISWLIREEVIGLQNGGRTTGMNIVQAAICEALEGASGIQFRVAEGEVIVTSSDGSASRLSELSDGQRHMFAMFGDLAIRAFQLNGHLGENALTETPGVVLIDELDMHLHPKWQRHIVHGLKKAFPKVQFIATSHSPQIISELPPEQVIILSKEGASHPARSFGKDTNYILSEVMDAEPRNTETAAELERINDLIDEEEYDAATAAINTLREKIGPDVELTRAEALVNRIVMVGT